MTQVETITSEDREVLFDAAKALGYYRRSAAAGYALAIERLLRVYRNGELGVAPDPILEQLMTIRLRLVRSRAGN